MRFLILVAALIGACGTAPADPVAPVAIAPAGEPAPAVADEPLAAADATDESIFLLDATWTDHRGRPFRLDQVRGHPAVVVMFYGTCHGACPVLVHDLQAIDESLAPALRSEVRYVLVTFDPQRDTEERLAAMAAEKSLDDRWSLVRGDDDLARELSAVLGVRYRAAPDGSINHTNLITLLGPDGTIAARSEGLGQPPGPIADRIRGLSGGS